MRNFVGGKLNIMHHSDIYSRGVIDNSIEDKIMKYAKPIADREIGGCLSLVLSAGGGVSKDFSDLMYRLARKRTENVLGPAPTAYRSWSMKGRRSNSRGALRRSFTASSALVGGVSLVEAPDDRRVGPVPAAGFAVVVRL